MIKIDHISHSYNHGSLPVLEGISFNITRGECVGLVGPSGSGKSTLAHIIAGHLAPIAGRILLREREVTRRPNRQIIMISQELDLFPWQTVERHITFAARKKDNQQTKDLIDLVKLTGFEKYYPHKLSEGMKKRLSLARALAVEPDLLILDEVFASLDRLLKIQLYAELKNIWQKTHATILVISHDAEEISALAQRQVVLSSDRPAKLVVK